MMNRVTSTTLLMTIMSTLTGCAALSDGINSTEIDIRNHVLAQKAWNHYSWSSSGDVEHMRDFARGFKAGYRNILDGGSGCQPTLPPQQYWKACYQTSTGKCRVHGWFSGFSQGALAASAAGHAYSGQIPISPTARANIAAARRRPTQYLFPAEEFDTEQTIDPPLELLPPETPDQDEPVTLPAHPGEPQHGATSYQSEHGSTSH